MKALSTFLLALITLTATAQNPKEKTVGDFNEIKVFDLIEVNLVKSNEEGVVITGEDVDDVEVINKNGVLKIRMKFERSFDGSKTFVAVHYKDIDVIDGNEGAFISSNELIEQDKITLKSQEGARLKIGLDVKTVDIKAVTGGIVETRGRAETQNISLNTGGVYEGKEFETKNTKVVIRAAGDAEVNASKVVDAKVRAGGDIYIYGNPDTIKENRVLGGRIKRM